VRCFDGDAGCDLDGEVNGTCLFEVDVCLRNDDPELAACAPADVVAVAVSAEGADASGLQAALEALVPATANACTQGQTLALAAGASTGVGTAAVAMATLRVRATTSGEVVDDDELRLGCVAHGWPTHGYNWANHRSTPIESAVDAGNAGALAEKWRFAIDEQFPGVSGSVTSTPAVGNGFVYVTSWSGSLYALDAATGRLVWSYDSDAAFLGLEGSPTLTADGRVLLTVDRTVVCLSAFDGSTFWETTVSELQTSEMWGAATVANGRVFVGVASAADSPCAEDGQLAALDLDSGEVLWRYLTTPAMVCRTDTSVVCESSADCPQGGECLIARGAGITAAPAVNRDGSVVYANTVGCYTFPSLGDSDSILAFDAASGDPLWKRRVQPPEQFGTCSNDRTIECGSDSFCSDGGVCETKRFYHDFGFLNGPLVVDVEGRELVASGSKDGTLYALDAANGEIVWSNEIVDTPVTPGFAGWGLFNGAVGYAEGRFYAALHNVISPHGDIDRLQAFAVDDGQAVWSEPFPLSWGDMTVANGVLYVGDCGSNTVCNAAFSCEGIDCPIGYYYVYDARRGRHIKTIEMPAPVAGGAAIVDGTVYVPYGLFSAQGGVIAFSVGCPGDCNFDGSVSVAELVTGSLVALEIDAPSRCGSFDRNGDGVAVAELVLGVRAALEGCASLGF
jgi:polyvinyl alcohol dehydrogenase (cytochrome)